MGVVRWVTRNITRVFLEQPEWVQRKKRSTGEGKQSDGQAWRRTSQTPEDRHIGCIGCSAPVPVWYECENVHAIKYELQLPVMWEWYEYTSIESEFDLSANGKEGQDGHREVGIEEESTFDQSLHILTFYWHWNCDIDNCQGWKWDTT